MKKIFIAITFCALCFTSIAQDTTKIKAKAKAKKTAKKVEKKAQAVSKKLDNKTDSVVKKVYPNAHKVNP